MKKAVRIGVLAAGISLAMAGTVSAADGHRYIVQLEEGVSAKQMTGALAGKVAGQAAKVHHEFEDLGAIAMTLSKAQLAAMRSDPRVKSIEIDPERYPMAQTQPYGIAQVGAPSAWASGHTGNGVMVCVIDSGLKADHEDFAGVDIRGGYPSGWNTDTCGHGTHVAGTVAAQDNNVGVVGVSPGVVSLYIVRYFGGANCGLNYASTLIDAANRCKTAADAAGKKLVINMSLGGSGSSTTERNSFQSLLDQGVLSIAAAGNDGNSSLSYPASYDAVMSVAAIDSNKAKADFSQFNSQVEISGPGVGVLSTYPIASATTSVGGAAYSVTAMTNTPQLTRSGAIVNGGTCETVGSWSGKVVLCQRGNISFEQKVVNAQTGGGTAAIVYNNAPGTFGGTLSSPTQTTIPSVAMSQEDGQEIVASRLGQSATVSTIANNNTSAYSPLDGTSMATPHVAGAAAVVWSSNLSATALDVRNALTSTAEDLGTAGRDTSFGFGLVRIPNAIAALAGPAPDTTPPSTVASLSASSAGTSAVSLSWSAATDTGGSGLAGYKIERCSGASCSNFAQIATTTSTSYSNTGLTAATTYRYRVRAYDGAGNNGNYSGIAQATTDSAGGGGGSVLSNGVPVNGLSGATGTQLAYTLVVPAGATNLSFNLSGGSGDADLYVKFGSAPTTGSYDCRSWASGNTESCSFASPQAGTYHVLVNAYSTFSGASLVGNFTPPSGGGGATFFENTADYAIPDNNSTGITSPITVSGRTGNAPTNLKVAVDIRHTYIGDLIVDLIAPDGSVYNLHNRTGGSADNIIQTYTVNASSEAANGTWLLKVRDRARADTGYINAWSLQF
ncbi:S8 family serine peptidase [Pseudomarimonas salicorniae]|uniref:S8 family serine peptidase n=1 Tax=Pseudomarimonas salicorniae TaxID=2933270 RepID=A0ABT0GE12_9GAMM|nr:S8 family serine peptidase [Lysobacter sp. CAU 1642]